MQRNAEIDLLKSISIIFVIIQHSYTLNLLDKYFASFYILQSVSVFIILSGYNLSQSYEKNNVNTLLELYSPHVIVKRFKRILIPFTFIWIVQIVLIIIVRERLPLGRIITNYLTGGEGPGGYYVPTLIQLTILFPIIYKIGKKSLNVMLIGCFTANLIFEILVESFHMPNRVYRLVMIKYLFLIALGIYLSLSNNLNKTFIFGGATLSIAYIILVSYLGIKPPLFLRLESRTLPSFFYPCLLVYLILRHVKIRSSILKYIVTKIGKASYHIFLIQMIYFFTLVYIKIPLVHSKPASWFSIVFCVGIGITFYEIENSLRKLTSQRLNAISQ